MKSIKAIISDKSHGQKGFKWKHCLMIGVTVFLVYLAITLWPTVGRAIMSFVGASAPLLIGCAVAYILNILMAFYERLYAPKSVKKAVLKTRRPVCMVLSIITLLAIIALVIGLVMPQFIECIMLIAESIPGVAKDFIAVLERNHILTDKTLDTLKNIDWQSWVKDAVNMVTSGLGDVVSVVIATVTSVFSGVVTAVLSIIFAIYILLSKEKLASQIDRVLNKYLHKKWCLRIEYTLDIFDECFHSYIVGQCIEAVILGTLCTLGMLIFQLPYAPMIGALIALTALIPVAGAYIGGGVGAFLILVDSPVKALGFIIFIIVLQQIEGNLIYPKVVGTSIGLPAIWVLAAVTIGGGVAGIMGMLLGVPIAAALYKLLRNDLMCREKAEIKGDATEHESKTDGSTADGK